MWNYETTSPALPQPAVRERGPCRGLQGPGPPHAAAGVLLPGPRRPGGPGGRDPGSGGDLGAHAVPSPGRAPAGRARPESQGGAVHLLLRPAGHRDRPGPAAHRLLLRRNPWAPRSTSTFTSPTSTRAAPSIAPSSDPRR